MRLPEPGSGSIYRAGRDNDPPIENGIRRCDGHLLVVVAGRTVQRFDDTVRGRYLAERCLRNPPERPEVIGNQRVKRVRAQLNALMAIPLTGRSLRNENFQK